MSYQAPYRDTLVQGILPFLMGQLNSPIRGIPIQKPRERGRIIISGIETPEQSLKIENNKVESYTQDNWPNFVFEYKKRGGKFYPRLFNITSANTSVDAMLLFFRYVLALNKTHKYTLKIGEKEYTFAVPRLPKRIEENFTYNLQICLKLKFIAEYFDDSIKPFILPDNISAAEVYAIEYIFRALTEGEFSIYTNWFELRGMSPSRLDLNEPPFTESGNLYIPPDVSFKVELFGQLIELGAFSIEAKSATPHSQEQIKKLRHNWNQRETIGIVCLDQEVTHCYDKYRQAHKQMQHNLQEFKTILSQNEPSIFATLIDKSLVKGIKSNEAMEIALYWLIYNPLPNYYFPIEKVDDFDSDNWHIKVGISNKEKTRWTGEIVGEIVVSKRTGKVINYPPFDFLWDKILRVIPINELPDEEILRLSKFRLSPNIEEAMDNLIEKNVKNKLDVNDYKKLKELEEVYGKSNVLKAKGLKIAVQRGLREPLHP